MLPIDVIEDGIVTFVNDVHFLKTPIFIAVTDAGIDTSFSEEQPKNALLPIIVSESGKVKSCSDEHP